MAKSILPQILKTYKASAGLRRAGDPRIKAALNDIANALDTQKPILLRANAKDLKRQDPSDPRNDRLRLTEERIRAIAQAIRQIGQLPDPTSQLLDKRTLENGLLLEKRTVPLGVIAAIYESRPNVTFDIAALCLRSRNACLLKGSTDATYTNKAAIGLIRKALQDNGISPDVVTLLPPDRASVAELLRARRWVDLLIPRGSDALIRYVRENSLVPVIETGAGVCHVYVEKDADLDMAVNIVVNAKTSRPSVCNAMDTVLVDQVIAPEFLHRLQQPFAAHKVEVFAEPAAARLIRGYPFLKKAKQSDFAREWLSLKCSVKIVKDIDAALEHLEKYSTRHSESIVSRNQDQCERWLAEVDAAAVYTNASTRFTDGEQFGLGAEIGISTQKLHARGPFALEKLVTEKWLIFGDGHVRP